MPKWIGFANPIQSTLRRSGSLT